MANTQTHTTEQKNHIHNNHRVLCMWWWIFSSSSSSFKVYETHTQLFFFIFCSSLLISCLPAFFIISPFQFHLYFNGLLYMMMMMELSIFSFCSVFFSHCKTDFISFLSALITGLLDKKDTIKMMIIIISMMMIMMCNSFDSFHSRNFFFFRAISCHSMNE